MDAEWTRIEQEMIAVALARLQRLGREIAARERDADRRFDFSEQQFLQRALLSVRRPVAPCQLS